MNAAHILPTYLPKNHSNTIFPSVSRSSKCSSPFRLSNWHFLCISHLSYACYMPRPSHSPWLDHPNYSENCWINCLFHHPQQPVRSKVQHDRDHDISLSPSLLNSGFIYSWHYNPNQALTTCNVQTFPRSFLLRQGARLQRRTESPWGLCHQRKTNTEKHDLPDLKSKLRSQRCIMIGQCSWLWDIYPVKHSACVSFEAFTAVIIQIEVF